MTRNALAFSPPLCNITAAWAVDREFVYIVLWRPLGRLWGLRLALGCAWAPFGHPLGSLWLSWATFSLSLGVLGLPLAPFGRLLAPVGSPGVPWGAHGIPWGGFGGFGSLWEAQCSPFAMPVHKIKPPGTRHGSRGSRGNRGSGVKNCGSEPTSHTRQGPG